VEESLGGNKNKPENTKVGLLLNLSKNIPMGKTDHVNTTGKEPVAAKDQGLADG